MLTENDVKEQLSYAYIHAVAAAAHFRCVRLEPDRDSIDVQIQGKGTSGAVLSYPNLQLQLKATSSIVPSGSVLNFDLPIKNYNDLRARSHIPRLLAVLLMPSDRNSWLEVCRESLKSKECMFWCNLLDMPGTKNTTTVSVQVRLKNVLTPKNLTQLLDMVSNQEDIPSEL
jgi:hypothetical protein